MRADRIFNEAVQAIANGGGGAAEAGALQTRCLADVAAQPVRWLWPGRIACGKVSLIVGNPGLGKSQLCASLAAIVSTGGAWPDSRTRAERGEIVFISAEDDAADTLRPRLEAAGADLTSGHVIDGVLAGYDGNGRAAGRQFCLDGDLTALGGFLEERRAVRAVIVDPVTAYLGGATDSHKNADVRALLAPLSELAGQHGVAIIGVTHLSKSGASAALMRVSGSLAFVAAARAAWLVAADPEDKGRRLFLPLKNNLGPDGSGLAFGIEPATVNSPAGPIQTSRVVWHAGPVSQTADDVLAAAARPDSGGGAAVQEACGWLADQLAGGPMRQRDVETGSKAAGIATRTLRRAADRLTVTKTKQGLGGGWVWELPKASNGAGLEVVDL
jgi:energy-coupling factor transporter ATP-binding protein EcfA2